MIGLSLIKTRARKLKYGASLAAASLLAGEATGVALDFTTDTAVIRWPAQPGSQYKGSLAKGLLTYTSPSPKTVYGPTGVLGFQNHNLCPYSEALSNAGWSKINLSIGTGNTIVEDTASTSKLIARGSIAVSAGLAYLCNVYVKIGAQNFLRISLDSGTFGASNSTWYNLSNGTVGTNQGATTASIVAVPELGAGVYKCSYRRTSTASGNTAIYFAPAASDGTTTYLGTGAVALTILGVELKRYPVHEPSGWAGYVATGATASALIPLDYDPATLAIRGALVEEQRTNLHTYSESLNDAGGWTRMNVTVSDNAGSAPDGTTTADKIVPTTTSSVEHIHRKTETITTGSFVASSGFFKPGGYEVVRIRVLDAGATSNGFTAAVNLTTGATWSAVTGTGVISHLLVERRADGWVRFGVAGQATTTATSVICDVFPVIGSDPAGSRSFTGDGTSGIFVWGRQCEQGASVGSYIPTGASQVTRAADNITLPLSAIPHNAAEHSIVIEAGPRNTSAPADVPTPLGMSATGADYVALRRTTAGNIELAVVSASVTQALIGSSGGWLNGGNKKIAIGLKADDFAFAVDGTLNPQVDTSGAMPTTLTTLYIGQHYSTNRQINGHVKKLSYIPRRLTNTELAQRSAV